MPDIYNNPSLGKKTNQLPLRARVLIVIGWFVALAFFVAAFL